MVSNPKILIDELSSASDREEKLSLLTAFQQTDSQEPALLSRAGIACYQLGEYQSAIDYFSRATKIQPDHLATLVNLGACYNQINDQSAAIDCYQRALDLNNKHSGAWANLGKAYNDCHEFEMAMYCLLQARQIIEQSGNNRGMVDVLLGLATACHLGGRDNRAREYLERAIQLDPENAHAHHSLASVLFHAEEYATALSEFEWRLKLPGMDVQRRNLPGIFQQPPCLDGNPGDKTLLLYTEQGYGDSLQFARFVRLIRPRVGRLVMWCRPGLGELFEKSLDVDEISDHRHRLPAFDLHMSLLSIPRFFDPRLESLSSFSPYLFATGRSNPTIEQSAGLNIGLVWGADKVGYDYVNKYVPLEQLTPLLELPGTRWYSLQVGEERKEIGKLGLSDKIRDLGPRLTSFADTADAIDKLDLVITSDTAVAHLAGALGKPVWVMLKKHPDWRWDNSGNSSLWYPSARLFRQSDFGNWSPVVKRLEVAILTLTVSRGNTDG